MKLKIDRIILFFIFLFFFGFCDINLARKYESRGQISYKYAQEYASKQDYIKSLVSYVESITYYTLAYHVYIDQLKDKDNFFRLSEIVIKLSIESDQVNVKALEQTKDNNKKNNILNIKSSNYLNFASTLQKMYGVDYKIATKKYEEFKKKLNTNDSIILVIANYFAKSIDIQLSLNNYEKAKEYFKHLNIYYNTLDNRIKDKYLVKQIVESYKSKIK
ncbi:MAG: hypothetical protein RMJ51_02050 [Candidatus Calescibacterium sp.]|nr:hypothetical protein [Candidatus Calescibacterium sp.]MCX7971889.1 hypothetical protein [bacterium]MDW8195012.1 hypothetical protein [Candidatus Calescibacterium sp.]